ncbi:MAG: hypothetical protein LJU34_04255 [Oscillospiraceae bacterium]|nr:hypothetical protein [Oscillospiraceae bacterium]
MSGVKQQSDPGTLKNAACRADDEGGAGIIAEGQKALSLAFRYPPGSAQLCHHRGSQGIASGKSQEKCLCPSGGDVEKPLHGPACEMP